MSKSGKKFRLPTSFVGKILFNLVVTLVVGFLYFYVTLPAINLQSEEFYVFVGILCFVYSLCALLTSGAGLSIQANSKTSLIRAYAGFVKKQCLPVGILFLLLLAVALIGQLVSLPIFRAADYRNLLTVSDGDFATAISEISFNEIPTLDENSAEYLSDRQMAPSARWSASMSTPSTPPRSTTTAVPSGWPPSPMPT